MRIYFMWALSLYHNIHLSNIRTELNKPIEIFTVETCHKQRNENAVVGRHFLVEPAKWATFHVVAVSAVVGRPFSPLSLFVIHSFNPI